MELKAKNDHLSCVVVVHAFSLSTRQPEQADLCDFEASLVYIGSSRPDKDTNEGLSQKTKEQKHPIKKTNKAVCGE